MNKVRSLDSSFETKNFPEFVHVHDNSGDESDVDDHSDDDGGDDDDDNDVDDGGADDDNGEDTW